MRAGWTLPEMLVALVVTSVVVALAAGAGVAQLRMYRGVGDVAAVRTQVAQAALITAGVLRDVPSRMHILVAQDSAIEVAVATGVSITCRGDTGRVTVARPVASGHTLASFTDTPRPGDDVEILAVDSTLGTLRASVAADPVGAMCARFPGTDAWTVALAQPFVVGAGVPVRFTRRLRLSTYRSSDGQWYLGMREWNPALARFNTIQPVAGPLLPQGGLPRGFQLEYRDAAGATLSPVDPARVALVGIVSRGDTPRPVYRFGAQSAPATRRDSARVSVHIR